MLLSWRMKNGSRAVAPPPTGQPGSFVGINIMRKQLIGAVLIASASLALWAAAPAAAVPAPCSEPIGRTASMR